MYVRLMAYSPVNTHNARYTCECPQSHLSNTSPSCALYLDKSQILSIDCFTVNCYTISIIVRFRPAFTGLAHTFNISSNTHQMSEMPRSIELPGTNPNVSHEIGQFDSMRQLFSDMPVMSNYAAYEEYGRDQPLRTDTSAYPTKPHVMR